MNNTKNNTAITPGPWKVEAGLYVFSKEGDRQICSCLMNFMDFKAKQEDYANAQLVAAAPDMLTLLKELIFDVRDWHEYNKMQVESFDGHERALQQSVADGILKRYEAVKALLSKIESGNQTKPHDRP